MDTCRPCGCKGCRTCLLCEKEFKIDKSIDIEKGNGTYVYCPHCNLAWPGWDMNVYKTHPTHQGEPLEYPGIYINLNFLSENEETGLIKNIDNEPWDPSQSGRRKQNYGPKCNFKKRKLRLGDFNGFPQFSKFVQKKFKDQNILDDFQTIEQCSLEYNPDRGASIDPHIDDCWIWGERIVTVNLLADSVLTMTYNKKPDKYNLDLVKSYSTVLSQNGEKNDDPDHCFQVLEIDETQKYPIVRIPMPRRSLLVMYGAARYNWEHQILREDIVERRVCLAYREFTPPYLKNSNKVAEDVILKAKKF